MSHNLNFGAYRIGNAYVASPKFYTHRLNNANIVYDCGVFQADLEPSAYLPVACFPVDCVLYAQPGHVYAYRGKMYVFITNAAEDIEPLSAALAITMQRIPERIRANHPLGGDVVDQHQQWIGKMNPLEQAVEGLGIDFAVSNSVNACTKSATVARFRGMYLLDAADAPSGRQECVHIRTQSYAEPRASLQMKEKTLPGVRYRYKNGEIFDSGAQNRRCANRTIGNRVTASNGMLGNIFEGGPEYSGFVDLTDLRKCAGPLMTGFLSRVIPAKTKKMLSRFCVRPTEDGVSVDQRVEDVCLNRVFIVYAAASKSFVLVCSTVTTFTDVLVDARDYPQIPYLYARHHEGVPFKTNIPCVLTMDTQYLLHDNSIRTTTETLFRSISFQKPVVDRSAASDFPLHTTPFFADRWRVIAMVAIMFAHESKVFALDRNLVLWFDQEFDRLLFEALLLNTAATIGDTSYLDTHVKLQLTGTPFARAVGESSFSDMLGCVDQLIHTRSVSYRSILTKTAHPSLSTVTLAGEEIDETSNATVAQDVWIFINSEIDISSMCTGDDTQFMRLSTYDESAMVR